MPQPQFELVSLSPSWAPAQVCRHERIEIPIVRSLIEPQTIEYLYSLAETCFALATFYFFFAFALHKLNIIYVVDQYLFLVFWNYNKYLVFSFINVNFVQVNNILLLLNHYLFIMLIKQKKTLVVQ